MKSFTEFAAEYGLIVDTVIEDGKVHRVPVAGKKHNNKSGAYAFYDDANGRAGWVRNYTTGAFVKYGEQGKNFYSNNKAVLYGKSKEIAKKELAVEYDKTAKKVEFMLSLFRDAKDNHSYLIKKGVKAYPGLKVDQYNSLIMPLYNRVTPFFKSISSFNVVYIEFHAD